jgi:hypothetical protein
MFSRELAIMIDSNVSPAKLWMLWLLKQITKNERKDCSNRADVRGELCYQSLFRYPELFLFFIVNMVNLGNIWRFAKNFGENRGSRGK